MLKRILCLFTLLMMCACTGNKVSQSHYQKIHNDMSRAQVVKLLGKPNSENGINIAGLEATTATWKNKDSTIYVTFVNDKVTMKNYAASDSKAY